MARRCCLQSYVARGCMYGWPCIGTQGITRPLQGLAQVPTSCSVQVHHMRGCLLLVGVSAALSGTRAPTECVTQLGACAGARADSWGVDPAARPRAPLVAIKLGSFQSL